MKFQPSSARFHETHSCVIFPYPPPTLPSFTAMTCHDSFSAMTVSWQLPMQSFEPAIP